MLSSPDSYCPQNNSRDIKRPRSTRHSGGVNSQATLIQGSLREAAFLKADVLFVRLTLYQ